MSPELKNGSQYLETAECTLAFGEKLAKTLALPACVLFYGELGAGKTTCIKGMARALGICPLDVVSPTFQYLNIYKGSCTLYHFDLYRMKGPDDFLKAGFEEFFSSNGIVVIEWAERIESIIPPHATKIYLAHDPSQGRQVKVVS
jgi:tRNA threonylcarbamoyladenosine biosynthesis protein TsaE